MQDRQVTGEARVPKYCSIPTSDGRIWLKHVSVRAMGVTTRVAVRFHVGPVGRPLRWTFGPVCLIGGYESGQRPLVRERLLAASDEQFHRNGVFPAGIDARRREGQRGSVYQRRPMKGRMPGSGMFSWPETRVFGAAARDGTWVAGLRRARGDLVCLVR
jgi:hypothetical protein